MSKSSRRNRGKLLTLPSKERKWVKRELWSKSKICSICLKDLPGIDKSSIDHIIPLSKGGIDRKENMQLTHVKCNNEKEDKVFV